MTAEKPAADDITISAPVLTFISFVLSMTYCSGFIFFNRPAVR